MTAKRSIEAVTYEKLRVKILAGLKKASGPVSFSEIYLWNGRHKEHTRLMLKHMERAGEVEHLRQQGNGNAVLWRIPACADGLAAIYAPRCPTLPDKSTLRHIEEKHSAKSRLSGLSPYTSSSPLASVFLSW